MKGAAGIVAIVDIAVMSAQGRKSGQTATDQKQDREDRKGKATTRAQERQLRTEANESTALVGLW